MPDSLLGSDDTGFIPTDPDGSPDGMTFITNVYNSSCRHYAYYQEYATGASAATKDIDWSSGSSHQQSMFVVVLEAQ